MHSTRPPGRQTRQSSPMGTVLSGKISSRMSLAAASKDPSGKGRQVMSPWTKGMSSPSAAAMSRAAARSVSSISSPVAEIPGRRAYCRVKNPVPHPQSRRAAGASANPSSSPSTARRTGRGWKPSAREVSRCSTVYPITSSFCGLQTARSVAAGPGGPFLQTGMPQTTSATATARRAKSWWSSPRVRI